MMKKIAIFILIILVCGTGTVFGWGLGAGGIFGNGGVATFLNYPSLQGLYSFENNLNDGSGKGNTLSLVAGTETYSSTACVKYGTYSFSFSNTKLSRTIAGLSTSFPKSNTTTSMTVGCWVRPDQVGVIQQLAAVADEGPPYYTSWTLAILEDNTFEFKMGDTSHTTHHAVSTTTISSGTEYHVVGTWDGSYLRIYVNGYAEGDPVAHTSMDTLSSGVFIVGNWSTLFPYAGNIDELAIFNKSLGPDEVLLLYAHGIAGIR
jgi:hypothetical protein